MSDQRPPEPGVDDPAAGGAGDAPPPDGARPAAADYPPPPTEPAIDLSEPEEPVPTAGDGGGPLVSAPDAEPPEPPEPLPPTPGQPPVAPPAGPGTAAPDVPPLSGAGDAAPPVPPPAAAAAGTGGTEPHAGPPRGQAWKMVLVVVVFLAVVVVAFLLGKKGGGDSQQTASSTTSTTIDTSPVDTSTWATFTDEEAGFTVKHPKDWQKLPTDGAQRVVLLAGPESAAYVTVLNFNVEETGQYVEQQLAQVTNVEGGEPTEDSINGQTVVRDVFETPVDAESPDPGVAVRYFVITKTKLYTMIFVMRPREEINRLARTIRGVANSFQVTSDSPAPEPASTTTTPSSAASTTSTTG